MATQAFNRTVHLGKIDYIGKGQRNCAVDIDVEVRLNKEGDLTLSMVGNIWNPRHTDAFSSGQNLEEIATYFPHDKRVLRLVEIWRVWHLNDMKAGCEHQRAEGWDNRPIDPSKPTNTYGKHFEGQKQDSWNLLGWIRPDEHPDGLLGKPCPVCDYKYGTAWLTEPLPLEVVVELNGLTIDGDDDNDI